MTRTGLAFVVISTILRTSNMAQGTQDRPVNHTGDLTTNQKTFSLPHERATQALATLIAQHFAPDSRLWLWGEIGVGKTTLARALIRTLCRQNTMTVPSPTFAIVQPYGPPHEETIPILHVDLYRVNSPQDCLELGLGDWPHRMIVEWPRHGWSRHELPPATLELTLTATGADSREAVLRARPRYGVERWYLENPA